MTIENKSFVSSSGNVSPKQHSKYVTNTSMHRRLPVIIKNTFSALYSPSIFG